MAQVAPFSIILSKGACRPVAAFMRFPLHNALALLVSALLVATHQTSFAFLTKGAKRTLASRSQQVLVLGNASQRKNNASPPANKRPRGQRRQTSQIRRVPVPRFSDLASFTSSTSIEEWLESPPITKEDEDIKAAFVDWSSKDQARFMAELGHHGESQAVVSFLKKYSRQNIIVFNAALSILADLGCYQEMDELWSDMQEQDIVPSSFTLATIFRSAAGTRDVLAIRERFLEYKELWTTEVFEAAIRACMGENNNDADDMWNTIEEIREWMRDAGVIVSTPIYLAMLQVFANMSSVSSGVVSSLLEELCQVASKSPRALKLDDRLWGTILQAFAAAKDDTGALKVLHLMNQKGSEPNSRHCTIFIKTLTTLKKDEVAVQFLNKMSGLPCSVEEFGGIELTAPDQITVLAVLSSLSFNSKYDLANDVLQKMKAREYGEDAPPNERAYNLVLSACQSPVRAREIVREMRLTRRHRKGVIAPSLQTYSRAIAVCRRQGDLEMALNLLDVVKDDGFQPDVYIYSGVIWTAAEVGDFQRARLVMREMEFMGVRPNIVSYNGLLAAFAAAKKYDEVITTFDEIQSHISATSTTFNILTKAARTISNATEKCSFLEGIYSKMKTREKHVTIGGHLIESLVFALGSQGRFEDARNAFESLEGPSDAPNLRAILFACSNSEPPEWELALDYLHTSDIVLQTRPPAYVDSVALAYTMLACSKADRWEESLNLLHLYGNKETSVVAFNALIAACGRCARPDVAIEVLNEMEAHGIEPDALSFRNAIIACNQAEHAEARNARDNPISLQLQKPMMFEWWECALSLLRRMKESGLSPDIQTYSSVISACEAAGKWQRALGVLQGMREKDKNLYCFNAAISACEKGGAWVEALELYERMKERGGTLKPNFVSINGVVQVCYKSDTGASILIENKN